MNEEERIIVLNKNKDKLVLLQTLATILDMYRAMFISAALDIQSCMPGEKLLSDIQNEYLAVAITALKLDMDSPDIFEAIQIIQQDWKDMENE